MRNFLHKILVAFSLIFSGSLLLSYLAPIVSPQKVWPIAFLGLAYPYLLLINISFAIYWIIRKRISFLIPLLAILIGYSHIGNLIQFNKSTKEEISGAKILSYNVRFFDKYKWTKNSKTPEKIVNLSRKTKADIFCFQEFRKTNKGLLQIDPLKQKLETKYAHFNSNIYRVAIFSKFPIVKKGEIKFDKGNLAHAIFADIKLKKGIIRLYNIHLESNQLIGENYTLLHNKSFSVNQKQINEIKDIFQHLKSAFKRRAKQADIIRKHMNQSPYPVVICGDFNTTANSYSYHSIKGKLIDSFTEKGHGISTTYSGDFPSFRIDYVLHDSKLKCNKYKRIKEKYSDHFPIYAELSFIVEKSEKK